MSPLFIKVGHDHVNLDAVERVLACKLSLDDKERHLGGTICYKDSSRQFLSVLRSEQAMEQISGGASTTWKVLLSEKQELKVVEAYTPGGALLIAIEDEPQEYKDKWAWSKAQFVIPPNDFEEGFSVQVKLKSSYDSTKYQDNDDSVLSFFIKEA